MAYETTLAVRAFGAALSGKAMLGQRGLKKKDCIITRISFISNFLHNKQVSALIHSVTQYHPLLMHGNATLLLLPF